MMKKPQGSVLILFAILFLWCREMLNKFDLLGTVTSIHSRLACGKSINNRFPLSSTDCLDNAREEYLHKLYLRLQFLNFYLANLDNAKNTCTRCITQLLSNKLRQREEYLHKLYLRLQFTQLLSNKLRQREEYLHKLYLRLQFTQLLSYKLRQGEEYPYTLYLRLQFLNFYLANLDNAKNTCTCCI